MLNWGGALIEHVPSTYFAWFVLPLLPWLRWDRLVRRRTPLASLFVVIGWYLLATLGPSNLWLFRWPVRVIEYAYLALAVLFAVLLSAGLAGDHVRRRAVASGAVVAVGWYLAWAVRPSDDGGTHLLGLVVVGAGIALAVLAYRRWGMRALGVAVVAGTVGVVVLQTSALPLAAGPRVAPAYDLRAMATGTTEYEGTVLQLAALADTSSEQMQTGQILFGNLPRTVTGETLTSYSGIGFREFQQELCMDYRGAVCPEAFDRLWQPAGRGVDVPLVDALRVSTLVVQRSLRPDVAGQTPPPGWRVADRTPVRTVWVRDQPLDGAGRVSWSSPGVQVRADSSAPQREVVGYDAGTAARVLFARLAWPGYTAAVDGRPVDVVDGPAGLLAVDVPAGRHTLEVTYRSPGLRLGVVAAAAAGACVLVQAVGWSWRRRRAVARGEQADT
jgi:hypothetical protein